MTAARLMSVGPESTCLMSFMQPSKSVLMLSTCSRRMTKRQNVILSLRDSTQIVTWNRPLHSYCNTKFYCHSSTVCNLSSSFIGCAVRRALSADRVSCQSTHCISQLHLWQPSYLRWFRLQRLLLPIHSFKLPLSPSQAQPISKQRANLISSSI